MLSEYEYCAICDRPFQEFSVDKSSRFLACDDCADSIGPQRHRLPDERQSITHRFDIAGYKGYITAGIYDDGSLGEIFVEMAKEGSMLSGFADGFATVVSIALQYGVPLEVLVDKFKNTKFEPAGITRNPDIQIAHSILDYLARWLEMRFLSAEEDK